MHNFIVNSTRRFRCRNTHENSINFILRLFHSDTYALSEMSKVKCRWRHEDISHRHYHKKEILFCVVNNVHTNFLLSPSRLRLFKIYMLYILLCEVSAASFIRVCSTWLVLGALGMVIEGLCVMLKWRWNGLGSSSRLARSVVAFDNDEHENHVRRTQNSRWKSSHNFHTFTRWADAREEVRYNNREREWESQKSLERETHKSSSESSSSS